MSALERAWAEIERLIDLMENRGYKEVGAKDFLYVERTLFSKPPSPSAVDLEAIEANALKYEDWVKDQETNPNVDPDLLTRQDGEFISQCRESIPALIAEVRRLRASRENTPEQARAREYRLFATEGEVGDADIFWRKAIGDQRIGRVSCGIQRVAREVVYRINAFEAIPEPGSEKMGDGI